MWIKHGGELINLNIFERVSYSRDKMGILLWYPEYVDKINIELEFDNEDAADSMFEDIQAALCIKESN